jgi:hypothetical protein
MSQEVSHRPVTAKTQVRSHVGPHVRFVVKNVALGQVSIRILRFSLSIPVHQYLILIHLSLIFLCSLTSFYLPTVGVDDNQD